ncbi:unnamed protein product [Adineta steineri]|uniref:Uncharacterized protein n=1 Tax=Adineta steineri TaxID=433720 RepID=A0A818MDL3_9BILA|nr:unnamed protein product [Adineta steineri]CAF3587991.1 unnamed protein product [Adineta steineri]
MNTLLSTSENSLVAAAFSPIDTELPEGFVSVVFKIIVSQTRQVFARIAHLSSKPDEKEILFSVPTVFRIDSVEETDTGYLIQLTLTAEIEERFDGLAQHFLTEIGTKPTLATLGRFLIMKGDYNRAQDYFQFLLDVNGSELDDAERTICYMSLGCVHDEKGQYEQALEYYKQVLSIQERTLPDKHLSFSTTYNNIGSILLSQGRFVEAVEHFHRSLEIDLLHPEVTSTVISTAYSNLALAYTEMKDYTKAIDYEQKALNMELKNAHDTIKHPTLAVIYHNLGELYSETNQLNKAMDHFQMALSIEKESLPPEHLSRMKSESAIALTHFKLGNHQLGLDKYTEILNLKLKQRPIIWPSLVKSYISLGSMYHSIGQLTKAEENLKRSLQICENHLNPEHPDTSMCYLLIGDLYDAMGRNRQALDHYAQSLKICEQQTPPDAIAIAKIYAGMSSVEDDLEKAIDYAKRGLDTLLNTDRVDKDVLAMVYSALANKQMEAEQYENALSNYTQAFDHVLESVHGDVNHPLLSHFYGNLGWVFSEQGDTNKALEYQHKSIDLCLKEFNDPKHPEMGSSYNNLACTYIQLNKPEQALEFLQKAVDVYQQPSATNIRRLAAVYEKLGSVYEQLNDEDNEMKYYQLALALQKEHLELDDPDLVSTYLSLALMYEGRNQYSIALQYLIPMVNIQEKHLAEDDLQLAETYDRLGMFYHLDKQYSMALEYYNKVLKIQRQLNVSMTSTYQSLGDVHRDRQEWSSAVEYYSIAIQSLTNEQDTSRSIDDHEDLCQIYKSLANALKHLHQFDQAMENFQKSLQIYQTFLVDDDKYNELHQDILKAMAKLREIH